jgi:ketopantoate reductase
VVRLGRRHDLAVPMNEAVYALLAPWAGGGKP